MENVHNNPYVTLLIDKNLIDPKTNCMSINSLKNYKKHYGVCDTKEGIKRFNIFASGNSDVNIFEDMDPKIFSVSGSIITACLQKLNPLVEICTNDEMTYDVKWDTYFSHYYGESDIDIMCATNTVADFLLHVSNFLKMLQAEISAK